MNILDKIDPTQPILLAGPTASGKSALALRLAERTGVAIVNADALQVYDCWSVLTARPPAEDVVRAAHHLYGHVPCAQVYSVGQWLRDIAKLSETLAGPLIITGGTGLYFTSLISGLADIPKVGAGVRTQAEQRIRDEGFESLLADLEVCDHKTFLKIDRQNPVRVQRAWEVWKETGTGLADWQTQTPPPMISFLPANSFVLEAPPDWLNPRIEQRFDWMMANGALDEVAANRKNWDPARPSSKAIGAVELMAYLYGELSLDEAVALAKISTRQYAKRQRSWFRARMKAWTWLGKDNV
jgi:tRNA dimethylallyltransferase